MDTQKFMMYIIIRLLLSWMATILVFVASIFWIELLPLVLIPLGFMIYFWYKGISVYKLVMKEDHPNE